MSRFYMTMNGGRSNSQTVTRRAHGGAHTTVAGWGGAVTAAPYDNGGKDWVRVQLRPWSGSGGETQIIYDGPLNASKRIAPAEIVE